MKRNSLHYLLTLILLMSIIGSGNIASATAAPGDTPGVAPSSVQSAQPAQPAACGLTKAAPADCGQMNIVPSPYPGNHNNRLNAASALASNDVWTVGYYRDSDFIQHTLVEHWNGTAWTVVPSPNVGISNNQLYGVSALAANDVWAVGEFLDSDLDVEQTLVEHWDGTAWSVVPQLKPQRYLQHPAWGVGAGEQ